MAHAAQLSEHVGVRCACVSLGLARSTYYARMRPRLPSEAKPRPRPKRALSDEERAQVITLATSDEYVDKSPAAIVTSQMDRNIYVCSARTMYRLLHIWRLLKERRDITSHPAYSKPELVARQPRKVWTWDITKLKGPKKGIVYSLYVVLDMYSRYIVGWLLALREDDELARTLIDAACGHEGIERNQLIIHADNGGVMRSNTLYELFDKLGVQRSHSRPYCSNDNPYSESQFKTMKYAPAYPKRFSSFSHALAYCREFIEDYNNQMYHSGIAMLTPAMVHHGHAQQIIEQRQVVLTNAFSMHPNRFVNGPPKHHQLPDAVWINKPENEPNDVVNS